MNLASCALAAPYSSFAPTAVVSRPGGTQPRTRHCPHECVSAVTNQRRERTPGRSYELCGCACVMMCSSPARSRQNAKKYGPCLSRSPSTPARKDRAPRWVLAPRVGVDKRDHLHVHTATATASILHTRARVTSNYPLSQKLSTAQYS